MQIPVLAQIEPGGEWLEATLTDERSESSYGIPVIVLEGEDFARGPGKVIALEAQVARGLIAGLSPRDAARALERTLRTGATRELKDVTADAARQRLTETAEGRYISIICRDGVNKYQLRYYSEMVVKSTRSMAAAERMLQDATKFGLDLMCISVHVGACPVCLPKQGMIYSLRGETPGFPVMRPEDRTPYHPWCGHSMNPLNLDILEADGEVDTMRTFANDPQRVVTSGPEYSEVRAGRSQGTPLQEALAAQAEAEKKRRAGEAEV
jgi:hypothetical protein